MRVPDGADHGLDLRSDRTAFGAIGGALLLVGAVLGTIHILAERRKSPIAHLSKPMKLASIVPAVVGVVMFVTWSSMPRAATSAGPEIVWVNSLDAASLDAARAKASAENRPVVLDFGAEWCPACKKLERLTFPDPAVRAEALRFVAIHVDGTEDDAAAKALQEKHGVIGLPTVIFLDSAGHEVARIVDFVPPAEFLAAMKKVPST